jgi:hypothetical protein
MEKFSIEEEGGEKVYKDDRGKKIGTYEETIDWIVSYKLEPLHYFLKMLLDNEEMEMENEANIALAILEGAEKYIYDSINFIQEHHGKVELVRAMYHQAINPETMLDIKFTPTN